MPQPLIAALPLDLVLNSGYQIRFTALSPSSGAAITGVRVTDIAFQVRPVNIGPGGDVGGLPPLPLLVPSNDVADTTGTTPTPTPTPTSTAQGGALHTQAGTITDLPTKTFAFAVADKLEPTAAATVTLPAGTRPFHALANAIVDVAVHLWAVAVADRLEA